MIRHSSKSGNFKLGLLNLTQSSKLTREWLKEQPMACCLRLVLVRYSVNHGLGRGGIKRLLNHQLFVTDSLPLMQGLHSQHKEEMARGRGRKERNGLLFFFYYQSNSLLLEQFKWMKSKLRMRMFLPISELGMVSVKLVSRTALNSSTKGKIQINVNKHTGCL